MLSIPSFKNEEIYHRTSFRVYVSEEDDVGSLDWADDNSDVVSIDSLDELDWEERIDSVLDM